MAEYFLENFGCRASQADGAAIERELAAQGWQRGERGGAEVAVLNTCTVTAAADADARAAIRRIHRENPECRILVTGCYAQRVPEEIAALPGVTWVVGNSHKPAVAGIITGGREPARDFVSLAALGQRAELAEANFALVGDIFAHTELLAAPVFASREGEEGGAMAAKTRPNLKVQDGCDNRCSFCVIPFVRGQSRSLARAGVLAEVTALVAAGYREVVISGINLGRWGRDLTPALRFEDLVRAILAETTLERLRISSVEPMDWSDELIALVAESERICKHAHVPLQSGSDRVLRMMHRKYRPWHYAERLRKIREAMPEAAIGADVMVGFPGETDERFEESRDFIARMPFTYLHVFTFSARPGTAAAKLPGAISGPVVRERNRRLRELAAEKNRAFRAGLTGREIEAITLGQGEALSSNYLKVELAGAHPANMLVRCVVTGTTKDGVAAHVAASS